MYIILVSATLLICIKIIFYLILNYKIDWILYLLVVNNL